MTRPDPAGTSSPDSVAVTVDDIAEAVDRALQNAGKLLDGTYSIDDAASDLTWYGNKALGCFQEFADNWALLVSSLLVPEAGSTDRFPTDHPTILVELDEVLSVAVTLEAQAFRAIGWGTGVQLPPSAVTFTRSAVGPTNTSFEIKVDATSLPGDACFRTLVFEGTVVDSLTRNPVGATIRFVRPADPHP